MISDIIYLLYKEKLLKYEGFQKKNFTNWFKSNELGFFLKIKILSKIEIITALQIRQYLRDYFESNPKISEYEYVLSLGESGKSGEIILYDLKHSKAMNARYIDLYQLVRLNPGSKVLFVDDLIGTGKQSTEYINEKLETLIPQGVEFSILTIFSTKTGRDFVLENTNVTNVFSINELNENDSVLTDSNCNFSKKEIELMKSLNDLLGSQTSTYDFGFLFAFSYSVPNNSVQFIWKDRYLYKNCKGIKCNWNAVLPRYY